MYKLSYLLGSAFSSFFENGFKLSKETVLKKYRRSIYFNELTKMKRDFQKAIDKLKDDESYMIYSFNSQEDCYELFIYSKKNYYSIIYYDELKPNVQSFSIEQVGLHEKLDLLENKDLQLLKVKNDILLGKMKETSFNGDSKKSRDKFEEYVKEVWSK